MKSSPLLGPGAQTEHCWSEPDSMHSRGPAWVTNSALTKNKLDVVAYTAMHEKVPVLSQTLADATAKTSLKAAEKIAETQGHARHKIKLMHHNSDTDDIKLESHLYLISSEINTHQALNL